MNKIFPPRTDFFSPGGTSPLLSKPVEMYSWIHGGLLKVLK